MQGKLELVLLHTNDIHSRFEQMPRIAAMISTLKKKHTGKPVLTIDCGDHLDRVRMETEGSAGIANVEVMNRTGYDIAVPGNNEGLTFTPDMLRDLYQNFAEFTVIGSNLHEAESKGPPGWLEPYVIRQMGALKVGLIGVTAFYPDFYQLLDWDIQEPFSIVRHYAAELRDRVDVLIVISHLGYSNDKRLASEIPGIDVILGGHTHHLLMTPERADNGTYICAAGKYGQYVGETIVQWDPTVRRVVRVDGRCYPVETGEEDDSVQGVIAHYRAVSRHKLSAVVVTLEEQLTIDWDGESKLGNLLAAGLKRWADAEIGLVNAGQVLQSLRQGDVTKQMLLEMCPHPINPCRLELRGDRIVRALEESLLDDFMQKPIRGFGFRGKRLGTLCVDGITVEYDPAAAPYNKITSITCNGAPFELEKIYVVGTIDMFTFGAGYTSLRDAERVNYYLPEFLRDVLTEQLRSPDQIRQAGVTRWAAV